MFSIFKSYALLMLLITAVLGGRVFAAPLTKAQTINLPDEGFNNYEPDDSVPDVTDRVGRISFIKGDAQIKRAGTTEWENVTLNLPIVEGDEVTTSAGSRVEIQFDSHEHLRLDENSMLQIVKMKDEGIAVSIPQGRMSVRITAFDKDKSYFEIDAPNTTFAVQHTGMYRIDAGKKGDADVRVSTTDDGEARVYSDNAGFTLKNGRSARLFVDGANAGEWEIADASQYADEFDSWTLDRDTEIAKRLKDAYYNQYYDQDIYGADDLNGNGEWIHLKKYGYVWRPYPASINSYSNWSPYRYGHWRWIPAFGWTWVNDEPWGWATYHHGRWFYDNGDWYWSPYSYYRNTRSWWFPALVVIETIADNICWYPLPYNYNYYNYNYYYYNTGGGGGHHDHDRDHHHLPPPSPTPGGGIKADLDRHWKPPLSLDVPPGGVVSETKDRFGRGTDGRHRMPPATLANAILSKAPDESYKTQFLPDYKDVNRKMGRDIKRETPSIAFVSAQVKTGAAPRNTDAPLDHELRKTRMYGDRQPVITNDEPAGGKSVEGNAPGTRRTGAVDRYLSPAHQAPTNPDTPARKPPSRSESPAHLAPTNPDSPTRKPPSRSESPAHQAPTNPDSPARKPPPRSESPARTPPPHPDSPPRTPQQPKSEPKETTKPSPPAEKSGIVKTKDGR